MEITPTILEEFKDRMHITHSSEDGNLSFLLQSSYADIKQKCGEFDIQENVRGKELVFERARYAYNDALEYFDDNFLSQINSFSFSLMLEEGDSDEEV